jgi:predicted nucleic acid-binding protein
VIVVDASAAVAALLRAGPARHRLAHDALHAPHLLDSEVTDILRRLVMCDAGGDVRSALAEVLDCSVFTTDRRLAAASGPRCPIELVPQ